MLIGLDIGGTKIEGVALNPQTLEIEHVVRTPTNKTTYPAFLDAVTSVITQLNGLVEISAIGIGCCGSVDPVSHRMQGANVLVLNGEDFIGDIQKQFDVPVKIANDADCLALSEFRSGAAKDAGHSCVAVIIGTGCGSGVIVNGTLHSGHNRLCGEIGHIPLPNFNAKKDGPDIECYCGSLNCSELFVSGTGFARTYSQIHDQLDAKAIFEKIKQQDTSALAHLDLYCDQLARLLGVVVNVIDPEVIVLGGGLSNQESIYPLTQSKLNQYTFTKNVRTQIKKSVHGDSSGVRGAAMLNL